MIQMNKKKGNQMSAYIINELRTPIGSFGGQLACFRAPELGAKVIRNLIEEISLDLNIYDQAKEFTHNLNYIVDTFRTVDYWDPDKKR